MADFTALKTAIQNAIKQNGNEEITGDILQDVLLAIVSTLGDSAINDLVTALANEVAARQNADGTLQQNITNEATTRGNADTALGTRIDNEVTARENADTALSNRITAITDAIDNGYVYAGIATTSTEPATGKVFYLTTATGVFTNFGGITDNTKGIKILKKVGSTWTSDTVIVMDDTPTENSTNLVKSGGVYASIASVLSKIAEGYLYVGIATAATNPSTPTTKVFYIAVAAGTYTNFLDSGSAALVLTQGINILKYNGTAWSVEQVWGVDDEPTAGSDNLVKSGGVFNDIITNGSAFDLTAYNNGTTYADLNAALTALNALPAAYKKGGMSMKYVQTSDNKYVQYRLMATSWSTTLSDWQGVDDEPTAGSNNLVESGGVFKYSLKKNIQTIETQECDLSVSDDKGNKILNLKEGDIETKNFNSRNIKNIRIDDYIPNFSISDNNDKTIAELFGGLKVDKDGVLSTSAYSKMYLYSSWLYNAKNYNAIKNAEYVGYYPIYNINLLKGRNYKLVITNFNNVSVDNIEIVLSNDQSLTNWTETNYSEEFTPSSDCNFIKIKKVFPLKTVFYVEIYEETKEPKYNSCGRFWAFGDSLQCDTGGANNRCGIATKLGVKLNSPKIINFAVGNSTMSNWHNGDTNLSDYSVEFQWDYFESSNVLQNQIIRALQMYTPSGQQISWTHPKDNTVYTIPTSVCTGLGLENEKPECIFISIGINDGKDFDYYMDGDTKVYYPHEDVSLNIGGENIYGGISGNGAGVSTPIVDDTTDVFAQNYSELTKCSMASALRWAIETLQCNFPYAKIFVSSPLKTGLVGYNTKQFNNGLSEIKRNIIKKVCDFCSVYFIDGFAESPFSFIVALLNGDAIHPNLENTTKIVEYYNNKIKNL